ncbi:MAG: CDGSH iron-sulfur domain-containing protein [Chloroflexi bacterium]|nr:CDGSH iron-sulfur domain-containing protein [Chloroflexota bacterium]
MAGDAEQKITVRPHGPYLVRGKIPLVRKSQVMSEHGEPLDWNLDGVVETAETYRLCRCGRSKTKPFCDNTHTLVPFDGGEKADTGPISSREKVFEGEKIIVKDDHSLCMHAGYCGNRFTNIWKMLEDSADPEVRAKIIAMVEMCPSGTLTYAPDESSEVVEPDLPKEVAVVADGPLWVTGGILVERRDGEPLETRNRVTLCRCGESAIKPFCDGSHKDIQFKDP